MSAPTRASRVVEPERPEVDLSLVVEPHAAAGQVADPAANLVASDSAEADWCRRFALWLADLRAELPPAWQAAAYSLSLSLVDDASIARLNHDWRQVEGPTDVLAFAALEEAPPLPGAGWPAHAAADPLELGDIVISVETASRQAVEHGHDLSRELLFLASHGLLHLLGWDHPDDASLQAMLVRQERLI